MAGIATKRKLSAPPAAVPPKKESKPITASKTKGSPKTKSPKPKEDKTKPKARASPSHPSTAVMVKQAVKTLGERGGSSLAAIKKSIALSHKVEVNKLAPHIRKYLKKAVETGELVQTKGKGAQGSFKLPGKEKSDKAKKISAPKAKSTAVAVKAKKSIIPPKDVKPAVATARKAPTERQPLKEKVKQGTPPKSPLTESPKVETPKKTRIATKVPKSPVKEAPKAPLKSTSAKSPVRKLSVKSKGAKIKFPKAKKTVKSVTTPK